MDFLSTPVGPVPRVATSPFARDRWGRVLTRVGIIRNNYRISPGLYAVGAPGPESPVLVTANYKLSFDTLRFALSGVDAWLLVVDTRGINVWCAAGKGTFSTGEITSQVKWTRLDQLITHKNLIIPQLGAVGVSAPLVKKECGFRVRFGPVRAQDIPAFLEEGDIATESMRSVTFTIGERAELIPVEVYLQLKTIAVTLGIGFLLSGLGPHFFAIDVMWHRTVQVFWSTLFGIFCGSVLVPLLLPWIPGRQFWIKGLWPPLVIGALCTALWGWSLSLNLVALLLWAVVTSSFQAMNFTGCTPFTSPSGVEFEMRRGIPVQGVGAGLAILFWLASSFMG